VANTFSDNDPSKISIIFNPFITDQSFVWTADYKHSVKSFQEDFGIFGGVLEESHAGIYWYGPKSEMDNHFSSAYLSFGS
jgi:hypothetical protein